VTELYDLVVVGAGPAGSAAALRALQLRPDARVLLLDKATFPRDKTCGDGIAPHGLDVLRRLGVPDAVEGYAPVPRLRVRSPRGPQMSGVTARPSSVVPREVFDARLVAAAVARGAELRTFRVRAVELRPDRVVVDGEVAGRVLVAADGANGVLRRRLGLAAQPPDHLAIACRGYSRAPAATEPEQLVKMTERGWPAYAWSFPVGDGTANVGFGKLTTRLGEEARSGRAELFDRLAEELPDQPADPATLRAAHLPLSSSRPRQPDGPVLLAGDALSLVNPLTGEGIYYALASGRLAGEAAVLRPDAAGASYRRALRSELGRHLAQTGLLGRGSRAPALVTLAVAAAGASPTVFDTLVDVGLGRGTVGPRAAAAVVAHTLARPRATLRLSRPTGPTRSPAPFPARSPAPPAAPARPAPSAAPG
jgi:menaquinone-9 beta-reductase